MKFISILPNFPNALAKLLTETQNPRHKPRSRSPTTKTSLHK